MIKKALKFLRSQQQMDGSILAKASSDPTNFRTYKTHPTIFFSALILDSLREVPGSGKLRQGLADAILANQSNGASWNYWLRDSDAFKAQPYPDDLDDTCCCLAALHTYNPDCINGRISAAVAQHLINNETEPGGPYQTWLIDRSQHPEWHDVDLAVNANIGYYLSLQGVSLPGLNSYIDEQLDSDELYSSYYVGELPIIYFLARWYHHPLLLAKVREYMERADTLNALDLALLLASAVRVGIPRSDLSIVGALLKKSYQLDHWPAGALYGEPAIDGVPYFAGSEALTTAFALEALHLFSKPASEMSTTVPLSSHAYGKHLPESDLKNAYMTMLNDILDNDADTQITGMADHIAHALPAKIERSTLNRLNSASIHGWIAYTIYDNVWDGEAAHLELGVANVALRQLTNDFLCALPDHSDFQSLVRKTMAIVDAANTWEATHARAQVTRSKIGISNLPEYGAQDNYGQLAARSWGHMLAAAGVMSAAGYAVNSPEQQALRDFFHHYLVARQLNDDAHDWEEDLRRGHLSAVVCLLIPQPHIVRITSDMERLRRQFWESTIDTIAEIIGDHLQLARDALRACPFQDSTVFESWLQRLESATQLALSERDRTMEFIAAYTGITGEAEQPASSQK